jgi:Spy/CpxP family protein refolding chaperone
MRYRLCGALALSIAIGLIALAQQPRPGGMFKGGMTQGMLLNNKVVQEELKLTEDQVAKIGEMQKKQMEAFKNFKDMSDDERKDTFKKMGEETDKIVKDLKPEQTARLKQIQLQQVGPNVFANADMAKGVGLTDDEVKKFNLTDDQKEKFKDLAEAQGKDMKDLPKGFDPDTQKKRQALRTEYQEKALGVLTSEQKKVWTEMTGKPVDISSGFNFGKNKGK